MGIDYYQLNDNDPFEYIKYTKECRVKTVNKKSPVILEVNLTTLGYWYKETHEYPEGKFINYHAGPAQKVEISDYPLVSTSNEDPLFVLKQYLTEIELVNISSRDLPRDAIVSDYAIKLVSCRSTASLSDALGIQDK